MPFNFNFAKEITFFVDYISRIPIKKKFNLLIVMIILGTISLLSYYEKRINDLHNIDNDRYNDIVIFYQSKLEDCNSENKKQYNEILQMVQIALQESQKNEIMAEKNRIELEKLKQK